MVKTEHTNDVEELVKRQDVPDSPFTIVTTEEGSFLTMGKYRISEPADLKEIIKESKKITWNRLIQVMMLVGENMKEFNELSAKSDDSKE